MNHLEYCLRDCNTFPCENFSSGPYPFSQGFLSMQERRRQQPQPAFDHNRQSVTVPPEYWDEVQKKDIHAVCNFTLADPHPSGGLIFRFLNEEIWADVQNRCLKKRSVSAQWEKADDPLLELAALIYFNNADALHPLGKNIVGVKDLKEGHFFQGPHELKTEHLLERYGKDPEGFRRAAAYLGGKPADMADIAYILFPFPRIPLYYLFWKGDAEFSPRISVLFDQSIEQYFEADAIWGLVSRVSLALLKGPSY
jgi:hypothetical protein